MTSGLLSERSTSLPPKNSKDAPMTTFGMTTTKTMNSR